MVIKFRHQFVRRNKSVKHFIGLALGTQHATPTESFFSVLQGHGSVAQLVEALLYKPEGHGFDSRWGYWDFSLT
jgi:hypothetical protein